MFLGLFITVILGTSAVAQTPADPPVEVSALPQLFTDATGDVSEFIVTPPSLRERVVTVDFAILRQQVLAASDLGATLRLELFPDAVIEASTQVFDLREDGFSWSGSKNVSGVDNVAVITVDEVPGDPGQVPTIAASFWLGRHRFEINRVTQTLHMISELDSSRLAGPHDGGPPVETPQSGASPAVVPDSTSSALVPGCTAATANTFAGFVDILAFYTQGALAELPTIRTETRHQVDQANQANACSGLRFGFRLVHQEQIDYIENANIDTDIERLRGTVADDPFLNQVHDIRDDFGADVVSLFGRGYAACGVGYQMNQVVPGFAPHAFSVVDVGCDSLTLAHEVGHNLSLRHAWLDPQGDGNGSPFAFNHGFRLEGFFHTIMAYTCTNSCVAIPNWSDPHNTYNQMATGIDEGGVPQTAAYNALALTHTAEVVSNFRLRSDPIGALDPLTRVPAGVRVRGWAIDCDTNGPIQVRVLSDSVLVADTPASTFRPDVGAIYPGFGDYHGYDVNVTLSQGTHTVCAYGMNFGAGTTNTTLGCRSITVAVNPFGFFESITRAPGGGRVTGWAIDPDTANPITVHIYVDSNFNTTLANLTRPDVAVRYPDYGAAHGFSVIIPMSADVSHNVCAWGINFAAGVSTLLACYGWTPYSSPLISFDSAARAPGGMRVKGWAFDQDTASPIQIAIYVDGQGVIGSTTANVSRSDFAASYPDYGPNHGFDLIVPVSGGNHEIRIYAINAGTGSGNPNAAQQVNVVVNPFGAFDSAVRSTPTSIQVRGWAIDPDTASAINVRIALGALPATSVPATQNRAEIGASYPDYGAAHGFDVTLPAAIGPQSVCITAVNTGAGADTILGCRTVP